MKEKGSYKLAAVITLLFFVTGTILIFLADGTADEGDSVMHFLYARDAFQYPEHFLNQWAKPLYVLITAPVAQLGFDAIKFFNLVASSFTLWLTFKTAKKLNIEGAWMAPALAAFAPMMMIVTLSGLTEPLFALWMMIGIYWLIRENKVFALLWLSFLPFIRSEGLIILCVLLLYLLSKKRFKLIPLLLVGHLVYSLAGYFYYKDFLWVFTKLSYATLSSAYGKGEWSYFINRMPEIIGYPLYFLLGVGLLFGFILLVVKFVKSNTKSLPDEELFLVYGCFTAVFSGHIIFWALGIFNSFGLLRVIIGVMPLLAIICLKGINAIGGIFRLQAIKYILLAAVIIFPFTGSLYAFHWKRDFELKADQKAELKMAEYIKKNFPDYKNYVFYFEACWISVVLDINYFDDSRHKRFLNSFEQNSFSERSFLVWDDWFARVEGRVELQQLLDDHRFELLQTFEQKDYWGVTRTVKLFRKR